MDNGGVPTGWFTPQLCCYTTMNEQPHNTTLTPMVMVGNAPAKVQFSGLAPYTLGVFQINILIPGNAPTGSAVAVVLSIGGVASNTVTIAIQ